MKSEVNDPRFKNMGRRFTDRDDSVIAESIKNNKTVKDASYRLRRTEASVAKRAKKIDAGTFSR